MDGSGRPEEPGCSGGSRHPIGRQLRLGSTLRTAPAAWGTGAERARASTCNAQAGSGLREDRLLGFSALAIGLGTLIIAFSQSFLVACVVMLVLGPAFAAAQTSVLTLLQRGTEDQWRGRVFSLLGTMSGVVGLVGTLAASTVGELWSPPAVIAISGALFLVTGAAALVLLAAGVAALPRAPRPS